MKYAIIGTGALGSALARQFARLNEPVALANSRGPQSIAALATELGSATVPTAIEDARQADLVILATPFDAASTALKGAGDWAGRILVDATNALNFTDFSPLDLGGRPSTEVVADHAPGARVVKAFSHIWARVIARDPTVEGVGKRVGFLSGNEASSKKEVADLMTRMGFTPIDLGRLDEGGLLASFGGALTGVSLVSQPIGGASAGEMDLVQS